MEVAGIVPPVILLHLLRGAFASGSQWLKEVAYRQVARLGEMPADIASGIRQALVARAISGRLRRERHATHAHLARLDRSAHFLSVVRLLLWVPFIDLGLGIAFIAMITSFIGSTSLRSPAGLALITALLMSHLSLGYGYIPYFNVWPHSVVRLLVGLVFLVFLLPMRRTPLPYGYIYVATWAPLALLSAWIGSFTGPLWWPLLSICLPLQLMRTVKVPPVAGFAKLRERWRMLIVILTALPLAALVLFGSVRIWNHVQLDYPVLHNVLNNLITTVWYIFLAVGMLSTLADVLRWGRDWVRWRRWAGSRPDPISGQEFLQLLTQYGSRSLWLAFVRFVRQQGLLMPTEETETSLQRLAVAVEHAQSARRTRSKDEVGESEQVIWLSQYTGKDQRWLSKLEGQFLDEVCKLLEHVRASRPDRVDEVGPTIRGQRYR